MGWLARIRDLSVPRENLIKVLDSMDTDADGCISLGEVITMVKRYRKSLREALRYVKR